MTLPQACISSVEEAVRCCQRIGYPVMLKASWGGGGKGIRKVGLGWHPALRLGSTSMPTLALQASFLPCILPLTTKPFSFKPPPALPSPQVQSDEEVQAVFKQVQGEVPGSPIFAMKLAPIIRHLEVQLLSDAHGNVASLMSRDCRWGGRGGVEPGRMERLRAQCNGWQLMAVCVKPFLSWRVIQISNISASLAFAQHSAEAPKDC